MLKENVGNVSSIIYVRMLKQDGRSLQIVNNPEHEF